MKARTFSRAVAYSLGVHGLVLAMLFYSHINTVATRQTIENVPFLTASLVYAMNGQSDEKASLPLPRVKNRTAPRMNKPVESRPVVDEVKDKAVPEEAATRGAAVKRAQDADVTVSLHLPSFGGDGVAQIASLGAGTENHLPEGPLVGSGKAQAGQMILPRYLNTARPAYPAIARMRGYEGIVLLALEVLADGRPGEIQIRKSSGYALLDQSALNAVRTWRFEPARKRDVPLAMTVEIPIRFSLQEAD